MSKVQYEYSDSALAHAIYEHQYSVSILRIGFCLTNKL